MQVNQIQHFFYFTLNLVTRQSRDLQPESDIIKNVQVGEKSVFLKNGIDLAFIGRGRHNIFAFKQEGSAGRILKAADDAKGSSFTASAGAKQRNEFLFANIEVDILQHGGSVKILANMLQIDQVLFLNHGWRSFMRNDPPRAG